MPAQNSRDFDFLFGSWSVRHRRLKERLSNCSDWEEFGGTSATRPILNGSGNIEDNFIDLPDGAYRAAAVRSFDAKLGNWAIWWLDERNPHGLDVPVIGAFKDGVGSFYADDTLRDHPIKVRFVWSRIEALSCQWEQAFSGDAGRSWETNWIMQFARVSE